MQTLCSFGKLIGKLLLRQFQSDVKRSVLYSGLPKPPN
jgi:hypothetical protein